MRKTEAINSLACSYHVFRNSNRRNNHVNICNKARGTEYHFYCSSSIRLLVGGWMENTTPYSSYIVQNSLPIELQGE